MLICHLTESFAGGVAKHIFDLITNSTFAEHMLIYSPDRIDTDKNRIDILKNNITVIELPMSGINVLLSVSKLSRLLKKIKPDVLHAHSSFAGLTGRLSADNTDIPVIYTPHGFAFLRNTDPFNFIYQLIENRLANKCYKIIAVSSSEREIAVGKGIPPEKIIVINNGIQNADINHDKIELRREWGINTNEIVICTLGRPGMQKGYDIIKKMVRQLSLNYNLQKKIHFLVPMQADFKKKIYHINECLQIDYIPSLTTPSLLLDISDIYLSTARWEGGPYAILEAMQHGLPVIASNVSGNVDYVSDNVSGFTVPLNENNFIDKILYLVENNELLVHMGERARNIVREKFSVDEMINKYKYVVDNVIFKL